MDLIAAQDQGEPARPARRRLDWTHIAHKAALNRQTGIAGKRASANDFRALTAKIEQRSHHENASAPSLKDLPQTDAAAASIENAVAFASPIAHDEVQASKPESAATSPADEEAITLLTVSEAAPDIAHDGASPQPSGEYADALGRDEMLALIKAAIEVESEPQETQESLSEQPGAEDMLALIRAAVFAEIENVPQPKAHAGDAVPLPEPEPPGDEAVASDDPPPTPAVPVFKIELKAAAEGAPALRIIAAQEAPLLLAAPSPETETPAPVEEARPAEERPLAEPQELTIAADAEEAPIEDSEASESAAVIALAEDSIPEDEPTGEASLGAEEASESLSLEIASDAAETLEDIKLLSDLRASSIDMGPTFADEFSTPYDEFSRPKLPPASDEGLPLEDETVAANGKRALDRPDEYKFWEQEESVEPRPSIEAKEPFPVGTEEMPETARSAALPMELPSEQAGQVAQSLLDIMSLTNDSVQPQERALAADTLLHLIHRLPLKILVSTAERLSLTDTPSPRIVTRLIRDPRIEVSGPLLEKCNSISDKDLIGVIREGEPQSIRMIARRRSLSSALCDCLIATREPSTVLTLVRNPGAELSHQAFFRLNHLAREMATLQAPLATRSDLPAPLAFELFWVLPAELRRYVMSRFLPDSMTLERILKITRSVGAEEGEGAGLLKFPPREKIEEFLSLLLEGKIDEATGELAVLAGIHRGAAHRIITDRGGDSLAIALKALGVQRGRFEELIDSLKSGDCSSYGALRNSEDLQSLFDSLSFNKARVLLTYWDWAVSGTGPYAELAS